MARNFYTDLFWHYCTTRHDIYLHPRKQYSRRYCTRNREKTPPDQVHRNGFQKEKKTPLEILAQAIQFTCELWTAVWVNLYGQLFGWMFIDVHAL